MKFRKNKKTKIKKSKSVVDMKIVARAQAAVYLKILHNVEDSTGVDLFSEQMEEQSASNLFLNENPRTREEKTSFTQVLKKGSSFDIKDRDVLDFPNPSLAKA